MPTTSLITGATGLVGSHIAEQLCQRGDMVRALVRPSSDTRFLRTLPVEIATAEFSDLSGDRHVLQGIEVVYHCAARVRDWGNWKQFYDGTVEITRQLVHACRAAAVGRLVHVSSISVFGNPPASSGQITEGWPLGQHLWRGDHYGRSKVLAEQLVQDFENHVIVRPSWIYGRRDTASLPRVVETLRRRRVKLIGSGENLLNLVNASDVARGAILAAQAPTARGQAYNLCSPGEITQQGFFDLLCERLELPVVRRRVPFWMAWRAAGVLELLYRAAGSTSPPPVTRRAVLMLSRPIRFSIAKAERDLGWRPEVPVRAGLEEAVAWLESADSAEHTMSLMASP